MRQDRVEAFQPVEQAATLEIMPRENDPLNWITTSGVPAIHVVSLLALFPWFLSPGCVVFALSGLYFFGTLGISLGYHRLLAHRSFECPKWLERSLVTLGVCCIQDSPAYWVATHLRHHHHTDRPNDPHSPRTSFFWSHIGWIFRSESLPRRHLLIERYGQEVMRDPYYAWMEDYNWLYIILASWILLFSLGVLVGMLSGYDWANSLRAGVSYFVWAACVRTVLVWHITFSVNSVTHLWGYRNFDTNDDSRNNILVGFLTNGEGWHNNHHAEPSAARLQRRWWEVDLSFTTIRLLRLFGLAKNVVLPTKAVLPP